MTENSSPLFRPEVLAERRTQWLGTVLLAPQVSYRLFALYAVLISGAVLGLLFFGSYTRTERVSGWLVPDQGMVRVFAAQPGVAAEVYVTEGSTVRKGERLVALSTELRSATLGDTQAQIAQELKARRASLEGELHEQQRLLSQQREALSRRLAALQSEDAHLAEEITLQTSRLRLAERSETMQRELRATGLVSEIQVQQAAEAENISYEEAKEAMTRNRYLDFLRFDLKNEKLYDLLLESGTRKKGKKVKFLDLVQGNY